MSEGAKKALFVVAGLLVCVLVYFFVYQPNSDEISSIEAQSSKLQQEVNRLSGLQAQIAILEETSDAHEAEMDMYFAEYPSRMTEQKAIYNIYRMMVDTGMRVTTIQPAKDMTFMEHGMIVSMDSAVNSENTEAAEGATAAAETSPETKVPISEIIGKYATYQLAIIGKKSEVYDALDWISNNSEHMSVGPVSLSYDTTTGKLSGTMSVNYYSMNGNGIAYVEPDTSGIALGSEDIFGTGEKKAKDSRRTYQEAGTPVIISTDVADEQSSEGDSDETEGDADETASE
ncbi:MAG: hypothetical protein J6P16_02190 [Eubacterium sp.]|nr:hypothetical protein [Eubacterium sp.]